MRKILVLLTILAAFATGSMAQAPYYCITAQDPFGPQPGYQLFPDNITVTVSRQQGFGGGGPGCGNVQTYTTTPPGFCGVGPYVIGHKGCDYGYRYDWSTPITDIRIRMVSLHDTDSIRFRVPPPSGPGFGQQIPLSAVNLSAWTSACNGGFFAVKAPDGRLSSTATNGLSELQIDMQNPFPPYTFSQFIIESRTKYNPDFDGVVYEICYKNDSCALRFKVQADSPYCTGRPIKLHTEDYPNTTHYWSYSGPGVPQGNWAPGAGPSGYGLADVQTPAAGLLFTGWYIDSAVRGACTYIDSLFIGNIDNTPAKPNITQKGPKCPGEVDTIEGTTNLPGGGDYYIYANPPSGTIYPQKIPNQDNIWIINNVSAFDEGRYYMYAQTTGGCLSDTGYIDFKVNPPVHASFSATYHLGCDGDTLFFQNFSSGSNIFTWDFGDSPNPVISKQADTNHIYHHVTMPTSYNVTLTVGNGICADDTTNTYTFDHPLIAKFGADADSVCQHTTVNFTDSSQVAPATIPVYKWVFGDGATDNAVLGTSHTFDVVGVYDVTLYVTDYLGCTDSDHHLLVVDSLGSISFESSTKTICAGDAINFVGTYSDYGITNAVWDFDDGNQVLNTSEVTHIFDEAGQYKVTFSADYRICPDTVYDLDINIKPYPVVDLGSDTTICPEGKPVRLSAVLGGVPGPGVRYKWNNVLKDTTSDILIYHPGTYSVTANLDGCSTTDSITVHKKCYVDVPNVFTPNGDGQNDYFLPRELLSRGVSKFNMTIFNRWGTIVFKTDRIDGRGWDGKFNGEDQPTGVYVYLIEVSFVNGTSENYQGNLTLLR